MGDPRNVNENATGAEVWKLITLALEMPETYDDVTDYWNDVRHGTGILLGMLYKLAWELDFHQTAMPETTDALVKQILQSRDEIREAWFKVLE